MEKENWRSCFRTDLAEEREDLSGYYVTKERKVGVFTVTELLAKEKNEKKSCEDEPNETDEERADKEKTGKEKADKEKSGKKESIGKRADGNEERDREHYISVAFPSPLLLAETQKRALSLLLGRELFSMAKPFLPEFSKEAAERAERKEKEDRKNSAEAEDRKKTAEAENGEKTAEAEKKENSQERKGESEDLTALPCPYGNSEEERNRSLPSDRFPKKIPSVLVVGLGNKGLAVDSLGPKTAEKVTATAHLAKINPALLQKIGCALSTVSPGVLAETGIESAFLVKGAVSEIKPDLVIAVDAIAAGMTGKLGQRVQISNQGIEPGAGLGNAREPLKRKTLGVPVISLGVPMLTDSSSIVFEALGKASIEREELPSSLISVLTNSRKYYVAPKEADLLAEELSEIVGKAIENAFLNV